MLLYDVILKKNIKSLSFIPKTYSETVKVEKIKMTNSIENGVNGIKESSSFATNAIHMVNKQIIRNESFYNYNFA